MRARLLFDRVLSYPGSLCECNFTSNFSLGRLHCLSDCVLSLCKSVCSYFGRLVSPCGRAPLARVVSLCFLALSKPGQPHQKHRQVVDLQPEREFAFCFWWSWRESNPRPARTCFNFSAAFRLPYDHVHCRPTKARLWMVKSDPVHMKQCLDAPRSQGFR